MTGLHINPVLALIAVLGMAVFILYVLRYLRDRLQLLTGPGDTLKSLKNLKRKPVRSLAIKEIMPLDRDRRMVIISVSRNGLSRDLLLLTGGSNDMSLGWLDETHSAAENTVKVTSELQGEASMKNHDMGASS